MHPTLATDAARRLCCFLACALASGTVRSQITPTSAHLFSHEGGATDSHYGFRISKAGDLDGDGHPDILVGSPMNTVGGVVGVGKVYVYSGADGRVLHEFEGDPAQDFSFGWPVGAAGDVDGDGAPDIMAATRDGVVVLSGRTGARLLRLASGRATEATLAALGDTDGDGHDDMLVTTVGEALVFSGRDGSVMRGLGQWLEANAAGDVDRDGVVDIVVGDYRFGSTGRVFVHSGRDNALLHTIPAPAGVTDFGRYVAAAGDIDADGHADVIVGDASSSGRAFVFSGRNGGLLRQIAGGAAPLAHEPKRAGDIDGDGFDDVLMTLHWGRVVVVSGRTGATIADFNKTPGRIFGLSTDGVGDINRDGFDDVLVGDYNGGPFFTGSAHVLSGRALALTTNAHAIPVTTGGTQTMRLDLGQAHAGSHFVPLGSASGIEPGLPLRGGLHLPLNFDAYLMLSAGNLSLLFNPGVGTLDAHGIGTASLSWPAGLGITPGTRLHHAALVVAPDLSSITLATNAAPLLLR